MKLFSRAEPATRRLAMFAGAVAALASPLEGAEGAGALPPPDSPLGLGWLLVGILCLANGAVAVKQLFRREPPMSVEFVTRKEFEAHSAQVLTELEKAEEHRSRNEKQLFDLLREQTSKIAGVEGEFKAFYHAHYNHLQNQKK